MDPLSLSSVSEQARENNVNNKFLLPRKPARQPNPIIYRKLRRGSAAGRFPEKQIEYPTNKELLRTIVYLRNATAVYYEPDKILPYNKAYIDEEDEEEWSTQSEEEKGQKELKKTINNSNDILTKKRKKKSSHIDKENKEPSISSSSSHVINIKEMRKTLERRGQGLTKNDSVSVSIRETFIQFCSTKIICPQEHRAALAVKLYGVQAALLSALGNPFENLSQSISSRNSSQILSLSKASTGFLPAILWTGMFIVSFVYTLIVVWSLAFRVPIISMLCLSLLYCLSVLVAAASGFDVMCGTFRMSGILFASLGVLGFVMLLLVVVLLVLFASWRCPKQDGGAK
ncbi:uncharacterized protein LOC114394624 isoform X1 [Glycine soja]|uniref:Transmembrane protein n=1 Tax=Glycine soja TaxID=3848 RepID=A0A445FWB5_GLYSO|nr:uncharacterized protein LOC114394624 isoform X1 [Glycine soja]KHN40532.1 hypothetical protein glysoja_001030 [Glycine soja]RZB53210.1 hypothetical protein D0Y65_049296 [Glycine soja]